MDAKKLFDTFRDILGRGLTQGEVDRINAALAGDVKENRVSGMKCSPQGISLIQGFEDYRPTTYPDPGPTGKPVTGGWGTTRDENGKPFAVNVNYPRAYWDRLFVRDLGVTEDGVNFLIGKSPTTQSQFDALVCFAYNAGLDIDDDTKAEGLGDSTLLKLHKAGDYAGARAQFALWNKSNGKVLNGLIRRRAAEADLYATA